MMDMHLCFKLAVRIDAGLLAVLGEGINAKRMVSQPLYARDVLLVCDALIGTELQALAVQFRQAAAPEPNRRLLRAPLGVASLLNAIFGADEARAAVAPPGGRGPRPGSSNREAGRPKRSPSEGA
jgi:hypothetical protein